jgi:Cu2+-containing amine oxidase
MSFSSSRREFMRIGLGAATAAREFRRLDVDAVAQGVPQTQDLQQPLDPLSREEIGLAVRILQQSGKVHSETRFGLIELQEPTKAHAKGDVANGTLHRAAYVMMYEWSTATGSEAVVDLGTRRLVSETILDSREPPAFGLIFARIEEAIRGDRRWRAAMERRGIRDDEGVGMAPLVPGTFPPRLLGVTGPIAVATWINNARSREADKLYLDINVDLARGVVTKFEDHLPQQIPRGADFFTPDDRRPALKLSPSNSPQDPASTFVGQASVGRTGRCTSA